MGLNPEAAESKGIAIKNRQILAFLLSGFIAGIGEGGEILGVHGRFVDGFLRDTDGMGLQELV